MYAHDWQQIVQLSLAMLSEFERRFHEFSTRPPSGSAHAADLKPALRSLTFYCDARFEDQLNALAREMGELTYECALALLYESRVKKS